MMMMRMLLWTGLFLTGCGPKDDVADRSDEEDTDDNFVNDGVGDQQQMNAEFDLVVDWNEVEVSIEIFGGLGSEFWCGLAETGTDEDPWVEESCVGSLYCHSCGKLGVELALGGDRADLDEGRETGFDSPSYEAGVTYYVENQTTNECWVFGHNPNYYRVDLLEDCDVFVRIPDTE
jgi:hypothetical protein